VGCTDDVGRLSECPGYVGLTVNSREDAELLLSYDLLVLCPPLFNITLNLPNRHQQTDKTFDLQLTDAQRTHRVFVTHLTFDPIAHGQFYHLVPVSAFSGSSDNFGKYERYYGPGRECGSCNSWPLYAH